MFRTYTRTLLQWLCLISKGNLDIEHTSFSISCSSYIVIVITGATSLKLYMMFMEIKLVIIMSKAANVQALTVIQV